MSCIRYVSIKPLLKKEKQKEQGPCWKPERWTHFRHPAPYNPSGIPRHSIHLSPGLPFSAQPKYPLEGLVKADPPEELCLMFCAYFNHTPWCLPYQCLLSFSGEACCAANLCCPRGWATLMMPQRCCGISHPKHRAAEKHPPNPQAVEQSGHAVWGGGPTPVFCSYPIRVSGSRKGLIRINPSH